MKGVQRTRGSNSSQTQKWRISGTTDENAAADALAAILPATVTDTSLGALQLDTYTIDSVMLVDDAPEKSEWTATVKYSPFPSMPATGTTAANFDTMGGTAHVTFSPVSGATPTAYGRYTSGGIETPPDFSGTIGNQANGDTSGCDITVPVYTFGFTRYKPNSEITDTYRGILYAATGTINTDTFKGCAAGECLFLGCSGSRRSKGDWELNFRFAAMPNQASVVVPGFDSGGVAIVKRGWDYLDVYFEEAVDTASKIMVKKPKAVYVHKVYRESAFSALATG